MLTTGVVIFDFYRNSMAPRKGKSQQPEQVISLGPQVDLVYSSYFGKVSLMLKAR